MGAKRTFETFTQAVIATVPSFYPPTHREFVGREAAKKAAVLCARETENGNTVWDVVALVVSDEVRRVLTDPDLHERCPCARCRSMQEVVIELPKL